MPQPTHTQAVTTRASMPPQIGSPAGRKGTVAQPVAERKASGRAYGVSGRWATVQVLSASNRGRNARGSTGAKRGWGYSDPKGAKRAKRQSAERMGNSPALRVSRRLYLRPSEIPASE